MFDLQFSAEAPDTQFFDSHQTSGARERVSHIIADQLGVSLDAIATDSTIKNEIFNDVAVEELADIELILAIEDAIEFEQ